MLQLLIQILCVNSLVIAQRTFLPGIDGRFRGFGGPLGGGPLGGGTGFFGGPPFGGPGFDFGPGPGTGGFVSDFPAIGGPPMPFTPPRGPPDFERIRRENGGFPVWGGAGINREDGTRAFDGWDGDPAKLGVGSFSSQVGPSHILASQQSSSDDNSRDLTVVQTTRVVLRPSPFRIPSRSSVTNQRETREQYTRSIAQVRRKTLPGHGNVNERPHQTQRTSSVAQRVPPISQRILPISQRVPPIAQRVPATSQRIPFASQRIPSSSHTNPSTSQRTSNHRNLRLRQNHRNNQMTGEQQQNVHGHTQLRDTGQLGTAHHQTRVTQNAPRSPNTLPGQNRRTHHIPGNNRRSRHRGPLVYHQRFLPDRTSDDNDVNQQTSAVSPDNWIPGPIPGLEMISNQRQNQDILQTSGQRVPQNQNNGHRSSNSNSNSITGNPTASHERLPSHSFNQGPSMNSQPNQDQQTPVLPNVDLARNRVGSGHRHTVPINVIIDPATITNPNALSDLSVSQLNEQLPTVNDQHGQVSPSSQRLLHQITSTSSSLVGSNSNERSVSGQHSMAGGATGGIGGVFGPTGPSTGGPGGRFADPTTGERIQVVSSDMASAVRQARVGGDPRGGEFRPGPVGQVVGTQGRFISGRTFTSAPRPVPVGPGVGVGGGAGGPVGQFGGRGDFTRDRFMGPGPMAPSRTGAGLLDGPGGPIRIRIPADGGRPIVTRDGVSQPLPPGMSLSDLGISSPPPVGPVRGPGPGPGSMTSSINNGFTQTGGFSNGTLPRPLVVGEPSMSNTSRLSRFQSGYGMFGRGRVYESLLSSLGGNYVQVLLPGNRWINSENKNSAASANDRRIYVESSTKISIEPLNNARSNVENSKPIIVQTTPTTIKTTTTPVPTTSRKPQQTTTTPDIPEEIEPSPTLHSLHDNPSHAGGMGYMHLSKFQRTVAEMLGLPASHSLIRNLSMIETVALRNGFEIEMEGGMQSGESMYAPVENHVVAETTTAATISPITSASTLAAENIKTVTQAISSPSNNIHPLNNHLDSHSQQRNTNIENNLTQDGFLKTLNSLLMTGKRQVQVTFDSNTGVYKLATRPVVQGSEWQPAHALRREHPSVTHTLTGFLPPPVDPSLIGQPSGGQSIVTGVSGPGPADMGHSHGSGLGEVHNANTNNNNVDTGVNNNGAPDLLVIQMADLRNRDNLPAIMNALENIANAQGGGGAAPIGINDRNNALGTRI